jgi:orotidine-5'-phosphate decarboxylase
MLGLTSNSGANDIERQKLLSQQTVYQHIVTLANTWSDNHKNIGLVIGATHAELPSIRKSTPLLFLIPGVGAQGGSYQHALAGNDSNGLSLINVGRQILYGSDERITPTLIQKRISEILK